MRTFLDSAKNILSLLTKTYEELHQNPEPGFQEKETTKYIANRLKELGIEVTVWDDLTGVLGVLKGGKPGGCVALRADIDALPMQEENTQLSYRSKKDGFMHACGHDSHTTSLLGAAKLLSDCRDELKGTVKFIFQPSEETLTGAKTIIAKGVLENPKPSYIFGMHAHSGFPSGTLIFSPGPIMASAASTSLTITGSGGHGAEPDKSKDPVVASAAIITALQTIVSRQIQPLEPVVITIGSIHAGTVGNIIPEKVEMKGTVRAFNKEVFDSLEDKMRRIINSVAEAYGVTAEFVFTPVVVSLVNSAKETEWAKAPLGRIVGASNLFPLSPIMGSEDFAEYVARVPGTFTFFGCGNKDKGIIAPMHNPKFQVDTDALPYSAACYAQVAYEWLEKE